MPSAVTQRVTTGAPMFMDRVVCAKPVSAPKRPFLLAPAGGTLREPNATAVSQVEHVWTRSNVVRGQVGSRADWTQRQGPESVHVALA